MKKIILHKYTKRITVSIVILLFMASLTTSCLQFRMSPKEADEYFRADEKPVLASVLVEKQKVNYAFQNNAKEVTAVFIHGAPGSWSAFADFMKDDSLRSCVNILSVDRPGYGYSNFGHPVVSLAEQARFISEVLKKLPGTKNILIGHSLGGPVAARMAMDFPDLVSGLVLVAPSIDPALEKREWYRYIARINLMKYFMPRSLWVTNEEIWDLKRELKLMLPGWEQLTVPVTVIQGAKDMLVPAENAYFAERMITKDLVKLVMLEDANHFIPWSQPREMTKAILEQSALIAKGD